MKIALTGGIACGKSMFAKFLTELGIRVLDADDVVHDLQKKHGKSVTPIFQAFGDAVLASDGSIDRARLASIVFSDPAKRRLLESIVHPLVLARLTHFSNGGEDPCARGNGDCFRLVEVPLLFELHWDVNYDTIVTVASSQDVQVKRMVSLRGYSKAQAEARWASQMSVAEKARRSHFVALNNSTPDSLLCEAKRFVSWLYEREENDK